VGRLTWDGNAGAYSALDVWVNPTQSDLGSPDATRSLSTTINSLSELVFRAGATGGGPRSVMDELVIATSWDDVVPVPEPSVSALFGGLLAGCLIILRRRIR
jgi:hypothetical protein